MMKPLSSMFVFFISCGCRSVQFPFQDQHLTFRSEQNSASIRLMYPVSMLRMSDMYQIPANAPEFDPCCQGSDSPTGQLAFHRVALEGRQCFGPRVQGPPSKGVSR